MVLLRGYKGAHDLRYLELRIVGYFCAVYVNPSIVWNRGNCYFHYKVGKLMNKKEKEREEKRTLGRVMS